MTTTADDVLAFLQTLERDAEEIPVPVVQAIAAALLATTQTVQAIADRRSANFDAQAEIDAAEAGVQAQILSGHKIGEPFPEPDLPNLKPGDKLPLRPSAERIVPRGVAMGGRSPAASPWSPSASRARARGSSWRGCAGDTRAAAPAAPVAHHASRAVPRAAAPLSIRPVRHGATTCERRARLQRRWWNASVQKGRETIRPGAHHHARR